MSTDSVLMQDAETVTTDAANERPAPVCQARTANGICGAGAHATKDGICAKGHALPGNTLRKTHGLYSYRDHGDRAIPADLRMSADEMLAGLIADKGGAENLTTLKREYAQQARTFHVMMDIIGNHLVRNGLTSKTGRVRSAVTKYLEIFDRFDKVAQRLGLEREARQVPSLAAYLRGAREAPPPEERT
jgi:hypothetical protein